ncbi:MAG: 2-isopropylmalate synthase [Candidatus Sumerlaeota bacterium]|nr:2-isopropylmalate synthase [Candidatus Sumerlaeota bacterium]
MTASNDRVIIFDTTLRDGEQSPGCSMNLREKIEVARQLARLRVDVIEAGFPISSPGDFESVQRIAAEVGTLADAPIIAGLARAREGDIKCCAEAVAQASKPRIHTFLATSPIHMEYKLRKQPAEVLKMAVDMTAYARTFVEDVEFSLEDAGRTDWDFMCEIVAAVIEAGAGTVNIPDTVGYCQPEQYAARIAYIFEKVPAARNAIISVHCHDDLGLAVANSLAAVKAGARQVECTINGIGERAGNASLEEIAMNFVTRHDYWNLQTRIKSEEIYRTSRLVSDMTGQRVQANKAIVGANAFAHESGIHQDGMLKHAQTYEIMTPESVGWTGEGLVMGKHSGRHAFTTRVQALGYALTAEEIEKAFARFKEICDKKKEVYEDDLIALVDEVMYKGAAQAWQLESFHVVSGSDVKPTAEVVMSFNGEKRQAKAEGDGPVDAAFKAVDEIVGEYLHLVDFELDAVTEGEDALGRVMVRIQRKGGRTVKGRGTSTDVVLAAIKAYINALNSLHVQELIAAQRESGENEKVNTGV